MKYLNSVLLVLLLSTAATAAENPQVAFQTNYGAFTVELYPEQAPATVRNFLRYVKDGFYEGVIFHRVIPDFIIQGGGYTAAYHKKATRDPVANEADNGLQNVRGSLAMARLRDLDSATSQFFVNMGDNSRLDYRDDSARGAGYTVFGKVVKGMETLESIQEIDTGAGGPFRKHLPSKPVIIQRVVPVGDTVIADEEEEDIAAADEEADLDTGDDMADDEGYTDEGDAGDDEDYADDADAGDDEDYADEADAGDEDYADEEDADSGEEEDYGDEAADDEEAAAPEKAVKTKPRPAKSAKKAAAFDPNAMHEPEPPDVPAVQ